MARKQTNLNLDTRAHLLEVAARMVGSQGYLATSMRAIAQQAGIEAASIYHHFASKEELVDEVMAHGYDLMVRHIRQHLERLGEGAGAEARFRKAVYAQMSAITIFGDYTIASNRLLSQLPERVRERQLQRREEHQKMWAALVDDLHKQGVVRDRMDPALLRLFIQACINSVPSWFNPGKGSLQDLAGQLCDLFLDGARREPSHRRASG
jgi:TetR/AcrR family transcriptional regulator, cholesterol catabolism regulator